jgi:hypothetical protein
VGLDTTHGCWHGAYSAFSRWRAALAKAAGYPDGLDAPSAAPYWTDAMDAMAAAQPGSLHGEWSAPPEDALLVILLHSDCGGAIPAELCGPLADRLEALLPALDKMGDGGGHIGGFGDKTRTFIAGLRDAASKGEAVEFH